MSEPIELDEYIQRRYGVAIDQIREMDADLADAIRWGVVIGLAKQDGIPPLERVYLALYPTMYGGGDTWLRRRSTGKGESVAFNPHAIFPHLAHLIEAEEPADA